MARRLAADPPRRGSGITQRAIPGVDQFSVASGVDREFLEQSIGDGASQFAYQRVGEFRRFLSYGADQLWLHWPSICYQQGGSPRRSEQ